MPKKPKTIPITANTANIAAAASTTSSPAIAASVVTTVVAPVASAFTMAFPSYLYNFSSLSYR